MPRFLQQVINLVHCPDHVLQHGLKWHVPIAVAEPDRVLSDGKLRVIATSTPIIATATATASRSRLF
jgi:hypothetical protein